MESLTRKVKTPLLEQVDVVGSFGIAAAGAVDAAVLRGKGFTVAKPAGVGLYRITLDSRYRAAKHFGFQLTVLSATSGDVDVIAVAANPVTGVFDVQARKASDGTAVDPAAACEVHFRIALGNTSLPDNT